MSVFLFQNISKSFKTYEGDFYALRDVNLSLSSPGLISIVGKSGSGKSTLLNLLTGVEKPTSGNLVFNNRQINKMSDRVFSKYHLKDISMVFQHYNLFDEMSAKENIYLPLLMQGLSKNKAEKRAIELIEKFKLTYLENQKVKTLSGGEKQRVAILRAIITNPKVLLCDEPTGALDSENSDLIMSILKELSKDILIINVSHNRQLVEKYSDRIITLKDGEVIDDKTINIIKESNIGNSKYKYSSSWTSLFTKVNFRLNLKKNLFSILACTVGFSAIFLSVGFYSGSQASQENALRNNLSIMHATASEKTFYEIENSPLSFEKMVRPSDELLRANLKEFNDVIYEPNLSYLFPSYPSGKYQEEVIENFQLIPLYDTSLETFGKNLLVCGETPSETIDEVIVNEEFVKLIKKRNEDAIDDLFNISYSTSISYNTGDYENPIIKDEFSFDYDLRITAVVKEFSFLNTPKIYYSYPALKKELGTLYLENISDYQSEPITYLDYILDADDDNEICSYSSEIFLTSVNESNSFFEKIKQLSESESTFQIESQAYEIKQSYKTFIESFSTALFVFAIIAFLGVNFILGMISLSTFIENKKNSAILTCLGARNRSIQSIYLSENYIVVFVSIIISIFLAILFQFILNNLISQNFALDNLISIPFLSFYGYPLGLPILLTLVALIFSTIFTLTPMLIYRHMSLADELRDE